MTMDIVVPHEQKINMSLDDLIKLEKKAPAKKDNKKKSINVKKPVNVKPSPAVNARNKQQRGRKNSEGSLNKSQSTVQLKVAKSVGESKAKRAATIANRRGLNTTAKPTKQQVKQEVKKQINKAAAPKPSGGLKISFKPAELNKTTDKAVSQQIRAVLSRQGSNKSVVSNNSNNSNNNNKGPKPRGKNLKVNH